MSASKRPLLSSAKVNPTDGSQGTYHNGAFFRDPSSVSANDVALPKLLGENGNVGEQTVAQIEIVNENLSRKANRSQLASKSQFLTRRWQTALVSTLTVLALAGGIGGLAYWITLPKVITQPYLLHGAQCYMNSRSCDATRMLWCPAGTCACIGNFQWNETAQNCSCGATQAWVNFKCQDYGSFGDPCNTVKCKLGLFCVTVVNQTYTTGQDICICDNSTYLATSGLSAGSCVARLSHNASCLTKYDCQDWLGLSCTNTSTGLFCRCDSTKLWNGTSCVRKAISGEPCTVSSDCDEVSGLSCVLGTCQCNSLNYWDNVTTSKCQPKKTYAAPCQYSFQCNTTVNLTCSSTSTGCNCPTTSTANMCDCPAGQFWDGQRCVLQHLFNSTCPFQAACYANLVCFLGHCICPGNMLWNVVLTNNTCACPSSTTWNSILNTCQ